MKDNNAVRCREDEHDWCEVPLHEEGRICATCGEIRQDILCFTSTDLDLDWPVSAFPQQTSRSIRRRPSGNGVTA